MRRAILTSVVLVFALATAATAQKKQPTQAGAPRAVALAWSDLVGDWNGKSMKGKTDSVITQLTTTYKADKTITITFPKRKPVAAKLIAMAGDSVIIETEPYPSLTRPGHKTSVRMVSHVANHKMWGTFRATYDDKQTLDGTSTAAHKMK